MAPSAGKQAANKRKREENSIERFVKGWEEEAWKKGVEKILEKVRKGMREEMEEVRKEMMGEVERINERWTEERRRLEEERRE